jgi:hypothetical protein
MHPFAKVVLAVALSCVARLVQAGDVIFFEHPDTSGARR